MDPLLAELDKVNKELEALTANLKRLKKVKRKLEQAIALR